MALPRTSRLAALTALAAAGALASAAVAATPGAPLPASVTGAGAPLATGGSAPAPGPNGIIDDESLMADVECDEAQLLGPAATSTKHVAATPARISLDVLTLVDVDGIADIAAITDPAERAAAEAELFDPLRERLNVAVQSYAPLGIDLRYDRFALLAPTRATRTDNAQELINLGKQQYGGKRPADVDIVYVLTDKDIQLPGLGKAVAGLADCIGGVALPDRAFAVGELKTVKADQGSALGPLRVYKDFSAKVAGHEIGHLMGGHHHYQECGTAAPTAISRSEPGPCTLMTNAVDFQTLPFSSLNGIVVRGHAEKWATATDAAATSAGDAHAGHGH